MREWKVLFAYGFLACLSAFLLPVLAGATLDAAYSRSGRVIGGSVAQ